MNELDTSVVHSARRYNYWLGGKDNFAVDRESGDAITKIYPQIIPDVRGNREWMHRGVRHVVADLGITQIVDIGVGIPMEPNVHEVAQRLNPAARVVYVDNDPLVMTHARALMTSTAQGATAYVDADMRDTDRILAAARETLDFTRPVAVLLVAVLHFIEDLAEAQQIVARLAAGLPAGSVVAISHFTRDGIDDPLIEASIDNAAGSAAHGPFAARTVAEVNELLTVGGLTLLEPVVEVNQWRPDEQTKKEQVNVHGGLARKTS
ncbi:SAM-dependent methyltransferase [Paractinoplanes toevensis]|uniref:SAM-dependent methyltransferase n=1 Tax=Paractinoplanes toevensis TaxID=571911 RepID=A0A919TGB9_9ACTN|nr:SAM-dependent methyltransferase [Actinoplanes toevensis]GIM94396.1 hypothetical protein Ato02nite_061890 [Actinoplanes toevensis]